MTVRPLSLALAIAQQLPDFWARIIDSSGLSLDDAERLAVVLFASGGRRRELVQALDALLDDAVQWEEVLPTPFGTLAEKVAAPLRGLVAREIAGRLWARWVALTEDERTAWATELIQAAADSVDVDEEEDDVDDGRPVRPAVLAVLNGDRPLALDGLRGRFTQNQDAEDGHAIEDEGDTDTNSPS